MVNIYLQYISSVTGLYGYSTTPPETGFPLGLSVTMSLEHPHLEIDNVELLSQADYRSLNQKCAALLGPEFSSDDLSILVEFVFVHGVKTKRLTCRYGRIEFVVDLPEW